MRAFACQPAARHAPPPPRVAPTRVDLSPLKKDGSCSLEPTKIDFSCRRLVSAFARWFFDPGRPGRFVSVSTWRPCRPALPAAQKAGRVDFLAVAVSTWVGLTCLL
jgi:hypothetical protein